MSTDIHGLDRHIGRYAVLTNGQDSAAGFIVNVLDEVHYNPEPCRWITLDWGQGWPVTRDTTISIEEPPAGEKLPGGVRNPIEEMHQALHSDTSACRVPDGRCPYARQSATGLRTFRLWRQRQGDAYWMHVWVERARGYAGHDDGSVSEIYRGARNEGAPVHILEMIEALSAGDSEETPASS